MPRQTLDTRDVMRVLDESVTAMEKKDSDKLRMLSDQTIHTASLMQTQDAITIAVIVYALSKIIARRGSIPKHVIKEMKHCRVHLEGDQIRRFQGCLRHVLEAISEVDNQIKWYIQEVATQAQIRKGTRLHEHGISVGRAAELLGVTPWEIMEYVGQTNIAEKYRAGVGIKKRLHFAQRLFK